MPIAAKGATYRLRGPAPRTDVVLPMMDASTQTAIRNTPAPRRLLAYRFSHLAGDQPPI